jgi:prepilin-type N-terminal cleavage/methylation domain-containing protein
MTRPSSSGFSLVELAITILILGLVFAFSMPAFSGLSASYQLKGATEDIGAQMRLARETAIATGNTRTIRFISSFQGSDYHIWDGAVANPKWTLPKGIVYNWGGGTVNTYRMSKDGRCLDSGMIILQDRRGNRDTVSVQMSGLVLAK